MIRPGFNLSHYEVVSALGKGGMGEVYRARDTKLGREVAIKVLPAEFSQDAERLARLEREARILAALNHPNIAAIYGLEESAEQRVRFLVLELVEGDTLAERLQRGAMPVGESLKLAKQIAAALEAAHERGVVHRDLKPANIKVTPDGQVKVLDFGLAKALEGDSTDVDSSNSPTISIAATHQGLILGTAAYMSPEQARGRTVDKRTDIWAFGVVLYEMVTGRGLFEGEDVSEILAKVIRDEPSLDVVPAHLRWLLRKCLVKDPKDRLRDIGDAWDLIETEETQRVPGEILPAWATASVGIVLLAAVVLLAYVHFTEQAPASPSYRLSVGVPPGGVSGSIVISPDGLQVAFIARNTDGVDQVWVRALETGRLRALEGTEGAASTLLAWSPDSQFVAFLSQRRLMKVPLSGALPQPVADLSEGFLNAGAAWSQEGTIVFGTGTGLMQVPDSGGTPSALTRAGSAIIEFDGYPSFLPGGRRFLYFRSQSGVHVGDLDANPEDQLETRILEAQSPAIFAAAAAGSDAEDGYLLYERDGILMARRFDAGTLQVGPDERFIDNGVESISGPSSVGSPYSVSATGVLAYLTRVSRRNSELLWYDREGNPIGRIGEADEYGNVQLSPDGEHVLANVFSVDGFHAVLGDLGRNFFSRVNPGELSELAPVASVDGRIALSIGRDGQPGDIYAGLPGEGTGDLWVENSNEKHPNHFSPDGRFLIYDEHDPVLQDLWVVPIGEDGNAGEPIPFLTTDADESFGQFSPNGEWIAYHSDDSDRMEVYVKRFLPDEDPPFSSRRWQVSTQGGEKPRWGRDTGELYYLGLDGALMAVRFETGSDLAPILGEPERLFQIAQTGPAFFSYDVSADGRFLIITPVDTQDAAESPITLLLNWTQTLEN